MMESRTCYVLIDAMMERWMDQFLVLAVLILKNLGLIEMKHLIELLTHLSTICTQELLEILIREPWKKNAIQMGTLRAVIECARLLTVAHALISTLVFGTNPNIHHSNHYV
jgi:hypothetical protein